MSSYSSPFGSFFMSSSPFGTSIMSSSPKENKPDVFVAMVPRLSPIKPDQRNFAFSPRSLRALVSLITAGASGPTLEQLLSFLGAPSLHDVHARSSDIAHLQTSAEPKLSFANALWVQKGLSLNPSFNKVIESVYKASSFQVDFVNTEGSKVISDVHSWVEKKTNGLIKEILPPNAVNIDTRLILANALYFKGKWLEDYFRASHTGKEDFHLLGGNSVKVPLMRSYMGEHYVGTYDGFKVMRLPYKQSIFDNCRVSMYIFLPDAKDGLPALMEKVVSEPDFIDRHLPNTKVAVNKVRVPRFKITFEFEASEALKEHGLTLPFQAGGLTEMVESTEAGKELLVSKMFHKCFVEVNEEGTEAAAVSIVSTGFGCCRSPPSPLRRVDFVADHPFMFLIREDTTRAVLFFGHILNPLR